MLNSFWEEKNMTMDILNYHESISESMGLPAWMHDIVCPFCKVKLPLRAIRSVSLKLNARNIGDVAVEIFCDKCQKMDTVYYAREINTINDLISILNGTSRPSAEPIIEEEMYKKQYNNVVEKMALKYNKEREK